MNKLIKVYRIDLYDVSETQPPVLREQFYAAASIITEEEIYRKHEDVIIETVMMTEEEYAKIPTTNEANDFFGGAS